MELKIPELSLVVLIGVSGSGKSTFARRHFLPTEIVSSDYCRALLSDDENDQSVTEEAFELLHIIAGKRLARGRLTVVDATNVQPESRKPLVELARQYHCLPVAVVFDLPKSLCEQRNAQRSDRRLPPHVVPKQRTQLHRSLPGLSREGFRYIHVFRSQEEVDAATVRRVPLWTNLSQQRGPFDIIGDVHGCCDELEELLHKLGYEPCPLPPDPIWGSLCYRHPQGRKAVFLGDLVDRGPRILDTVRLVRNMVQHGYALCVPGNHDVKLLRKLRGRNVRITHGLDRTLAELEALPPQLREPFRKALAEFLDSLVSHYVLDGGRLVVAHAGMKEEMQGRASARVREFALYGETTGETDQFGLPVRYDWAREYRGRATVVYGHTPVPEPEWLNRTINIDTGCVFGGRLTALRYPEKELVSVPARKQYCAPVRPFLPQQKQPSPEQPRQVYDDLLRAEDVLGKRIIHTRLQGNIAIRAENAAAALEVMSRFAVDPRWLIYLPPTMSPCETSKRPGLLEHPEEAFAFYRSRGQGEVVCQEKHMGSRAVVILCREEQVARRRFGVEEPCLGIVYTRTGRRFFDDEELEQQLLGRLCRAVEKAGLWQQLRSDWLCLDCELLPWSAKAQELLRAQYAAVGAAGRMALPRALSALEQAVARLEAEEQAQAEQALRRYRQSLENLERFTAAYRRYCWPVERLSDLKLAPFHLLASEGKVHTDQTHLWHMETLARVCRQDPEVLLATKYRLVDLTDPQSQQQATQWWEQYTAQGGEGMVVKPREWIARGRRGLIQPALKCRGEEYLRIIYGPDYTNEEHLVRLRQRSLGRKRGLALREFVLGLEALERFVAGEPLHRVHECVFGVLALESEPVDPRL